MSGHTYIQAHLKEKDHGHICFNNLKTSGTFQKSNVTEKFF